MEEKKKKRIIVLLLMLSCIISSTILIYSPDSETRSLKSYAFADSLIYRDLKKFNIPRDQIRFHSVNLDSGSRKTFTVKVPPGFSMTQLHTELNQTFHPYDIKTPAKVTFPEKSVAIHLLHNHTVFRTIEMRTDSELMMQRNFASILIAFEKIPSQSLLDKIISFGEPMSLVLIVENPMDANELRNRFQGVYANILFWLQDERGNNVLTNDYSNALPRLQHLQEAIPNASILSFKTLNSSESKNYVQVLSKTSLNYVDVSEAILLDTNLGKTAFMQELEKFSLKAQQNEYPIAIVRGGEDALDWLKAGLDDFRKAGLQIIRPPEKRL